MKIVKKVLLWVAAVFFGVIAVAALPHFSAVLGVLVVALLLPIDKWQNIVKKAIKGKWKTILAVVLAVAMFFTLPVSDSAEETDSSVAGGTVAVSTTSTSTENINSSVTEEASSTTKTITTQKATTTTTKASAITKAPTTTTKKITTTTTKIITTKKSTTTKKITTTEQKTKYVLNTDSKKFHYITCRKLPTKNREDVTMSREEIINMGYSPCGICKP